MYEFCPIGAIVCTLCAYPVCNRRGFILGITAHEDNNKNHPVKLNYKDRVALVKKFDNYIKKLAHAVVVLLPDITMARNVILKNVDSIKTYKLCTSEQCTKIVVSAREHNGGRHFATCTVDCDGYASLYWKKKEPKILDAEFKLINNGGEVCELLCISLRDAIRKHDLYIPIANADKLEHKKVIMNAAISSQETIFDEIERNQKVQFIEINKNPDLWISHTGWHKYLDGYVASEINDITKTFDEYDNAFNLQLEKNFESALKDCVTFVQNMNPLHQNFFEVERRPNMPYPNKRFILPSNESMERYIRTIRMIFRVVVCVHEHQQRNNEEETHKYPQIPFSPEQNDIINDIKAHPNTAQNYIDLLLLMIGQTYSEHPYECALVCVLAFTSLNHDGTFKIPSSFTGTYAALIGISKVLVIQKSMTDVTTSTSSIQLIQGYVKKYLTHPKDEILHPNVMSYVINIFSYAIAVSRNTPVDGFITWDGHTIIFQNIRMSLLDFRSAILQNINDAEVLLTKLCEVSSMNALPNIPWNSTYDNFNCNEYKYSFLTDPKNDYMTTSKIFNDHRNMDLWINDDDTFNVPHIKRFKREIKTFLEVLLCLVHVTGGQPARGTEIIIYQHSNGSSSSGGSRNVFIDRGMVCLFSHYHKNIIKANRTKDIFRFLPQRVGNLMVYYLWLVLPYYQKVVGSCESKVYKSTFIWTDHIVDSNEKSIAWNSLCLTKSLQKFFATKVGCVINTNQYRHIVIAIVRKYLDSHIMVKEDGTDNDDDETNSNNIWDLQAAHSTKTSLNVYAQKIADHHHSNESLVDRFRIISIVWHNFILHEQTNHHGATADQLSNILHEQRLRRIHRLLSLSPETLLKNFIGSDAMFRGNQKSVISAIMKGVPTILQIAGTGVGKSMSFLLPAYSTISGTTIVIVPLKALQEDLVLRCTKHGVVAKIWNDIERYNDENIFFVTPESASKPKFLDFLNWLKVRHQLDRIFIDECHLLLSNSNTFRKKMDDLKTALKVANVQLVMLTATLPKQQESDLFERLDLNDDVEIFRDSTVRKNISYKVMEASRSNFVLTLKGILSTINNGRCIIYARTLDLGAQLSVELGLDHYHSKSENKREKFERWAASTNHPCILATSALGCGLDIPDIRYVIHIGCPGSLCDFAQESGRAGRDGQKSFSILMNIASMNFKVDDNDIIQFIDTSNCRRIILDSVLDGDVERKECGADEEMCDICFDRKQKDTCDEMLKDIDEAFFDDEEFGIEQPNGNKQASEDSEMVVQAEERRYKKIRVESIERAVTSVAISELIDRFREAKCLICELSNKTNCHNQSEHTALTSAARRRSLNFIGMYRRTRHKIEKYVVCFKCLCPQDICTQKFGDKGDCPNMFVMLDVIYLICILDNSMNRIEYNDTNHMLEIIRNYGHYEKTIRLVSIFHDLALSVISKN